MATNDEDPTVLSAAAKTRLDCFELLDGLPTMLEEMSMALTIDDWSSLRDACTALVLAGSTLLNAAGALEAVYPQSGGSGG